MRDLGANYGITCAQVLLARLLLRAKFFRFRKGLVAGACTVPNAPVIPFHFEISHAAA